MHLVVGTRASALALWQTETMVNALRAAHPTLEVEIHQMQALGDRVTDRPLAQIGERGLFTRDFEEALRDGRIDMAVHSLKDLPSRLPADLIIAAVSPRQDPRDALISPQARSFADLPIGATIGTSSLRRRAQILQARPDLHMVDMRGNIDTRLRKLDAGACAATILAAAGLQRLGLDNRITAYLPPSLCLPAVSQGVMAVEVHADHLQLRHLLGTISDRAADIETTAERAFLRHFDGGCQVPIAALAQYNPTTQDVHIDGLVASLDGQTVLRDQHTGPASQAEAIGLALARRLVTKGANAILAESRWLATANSLPNSEDG